MCQEAGAPTPNHRGVCGTADQNLWLAWLYDNLPFPLILPGTNVQPLLEQNSRVPRARVHLSSTLPAQPSCPPLSPWWGVTPGTHGAPLPQAARKAGRSAIHPVPHPDPPTPTCTLMVSMLVWLPTCLATSWCPHWGPMVPAAQVLWIWGSGRQ